MFLRLGILGYIFIWGVSGTVFSSLLIIRQKRDRNPRYGEGYLPDYQKRASMAGGYALGLIWPLTIIAFLVWKIALALYNHGIEGAVDSVTLWLETRAEKPSLGKLERP